jgi:hypothetical protein
MPAELAHYQAPGMDHSQRRVLPRMSLHGKRYVNGTLLFSHKTGDFATEIKQTALISRPGAAN